MRSPSRGGGLPCIAAPSIKFAFITKKQLLNRCALFNDCCAYCGKFAGMDIELEHVIPRSKDGPHCLSNIIPACHSCNQSKRAKDMTKWYKQQSFYSYQSLKKIKEVNCTARLHNKCHDVL